MDREFGSHRFIFVPILGVISCLTGGLAPIQKMHATREYHVIVKGQQVYHNRSEINVSFELESLVMSVGEVVWRGCQISSFRLYNLLYWTTLNLSGNKSHNKCMLESGRKNDVKSTHFMETLTDRHKVKHMNELTPYFLFSWVLSPRPFDVMCGIFLRIHIPQVHTMRTGESHSFRESPLCVTVTRITCFRSAFLKRVCS
jgi:hypothetical protein